MKHGNNMKWLLWKEYRQNRLIVYVMLFLLVIPYVIGLSILWKWGIRSRFEGPQWKVCLAVTAFYSLGISQLAMALIGGNAIAGERVDRSAEFQAYLPIPRNKIFASKMLLALLMAGVIWLPNAVILWGTSDVLMPERSDYQVIREILGSIAIVGLMLFCVAWFFSATIHSPTFAVCAGLISPLPVYCAICAIADIRDLPLDSLIEFWFPTICLILAPVCFVLGTWLYLRRVEP
jgi:ABC-type transport system involved in multi-copper enzyme maturation permease subunit